MRIVEIARGVAWHGLRNSLVSLFGRYAHRLQSDVPDGPYRLGTVERRLLLGNRHLAKGYKPAGLAVPVGFLSTRHSQLSS